jgi:unsaturated rhamnogalacturonyl hydrolase
MGLISRYVLLNFLLLISISGNTQNWVDSLDLYAREAYMPAHKYKWDWGQATMLNAMVHLYHHKPDAVKPIYLEYLTVAMDNTYNVANGLHPNAVASGHGMVFLAKLTGEERYIEKANQIYADYLTTPRTKQGGVSHRTETVELWDDTVYMLGLFLLEMYRFTGDEKYLAEFQKQYAIHKDKLSNKKWKLWVHGYDDDADNYPDRCCQANWADLTPARTNIEFWGRGNGWIVMAIADALQAAPAKSSYYKYFANELRQITKHLPKLQDKETGLWYQLPIYPREKGNFLESSCTAMFGYGISIGIRHKVLNEKMFLPVVVKAFDGLQKHATVADGRYLIPSLVCEGTCIGDKSYYYKRKTINGANFAIGSYIMFGLEYEKLLSDGL